MHGGTAESQVVPLKKKSDVREWRAQETGVGGLYLDGIPGSEKGGRKKGSLASSHKTKKVQVEQREDL